MASDLVSENEYSTEARNPEQLPRHSSPYMYLVLHSSPHCPFLTLLEHASAKNMVFSLLLVESQSSILFTTTICLRSMSIPRIRALHRHLGLSFRMSTSNVSHYHTLRTTFTSVLQSFASSPSAFQVVYSCPPSSPVSSSPVSTLYVLDSSFNPPSRAHMQLARSALEEDGGEGSKRLLLLLATVNADKKPKPAVFEDRLVMMCIMGKSRSCSVTVQKWNKAACTSGRNYA